MISLEVGRTLVKSPPELWAELSDPGRLARHLQELGDVRIVNLDPERTVEWEAQDARGSVLMRPSGWGTKVTLTVLRETPEPGPLDAPGDRVEPRTPVEPQPPAAWRAPEPELRVSPQTAAAAEPPAEAESQAETHVGGPAEADTQIEAETQVEPENQAEAEAEYEYELEYDFEAEPEPEAQLEPRRGFLARLFRRWERKQAVEHEWLELVEASHPTAEPDAEMPPPQAAIAHEELGPPAEPEAAFPEPEAVSPEPEAVSGPPVAAAPDISAELQRAEEVAAEQVKAVLTSMLDRLGAAHHRPFSRA